MNSMALLALFVWVGVPLLAMLFGMLLWRRSKTPMGKPRALITSIAVLFSPLLVSNGVKAYYDRQVRELCAKDGGARVYEVVRLPVEKTNEFGQPNFHIPIAPYDEIKETDEYLLEWEITDLKKGYPNLKRNHFQLIRRSDQKLLGELVSYSRGGGDLPGPWANSSFTCPDKHKEISLFTQVFIKLRSEE